MADSSIPVDETIEDFGDFSSGTQEAFNNLSEVQRKQVASMSPAQIKSAVQGMAPEGQDTLREPPMPQEPPVRQTTELSPMADDLFQQDDILPTSEITWGSFSMPVAPTKEAISISLLQEGHEVNATMLDAHQEKTSQINSGDESFVEQASTLTWKQKRDKRRDVMLAEEKIDLQKLHEGEVLLDGIWSPLEHKIASTEETLTTKLILQDIEDNPDETERLEMLLSAADKDIRYRQAINDANRMLATMSDELGIGETIGDIALSIFQPLAEQATFHNVITEVVPAANLSGIAIPSKDADDFTKYITNLPRDQGALAINDFMEAVYQRQNQLGVAENKLTNLWVASTLMNYLTEDRSVEEGSGFLGMQNVSDVGLNLLGALELMSAGAFTEFVTMMTAKTLRKPKPYTDFGVSESAWHAKLLKAKQGQTKVEKALDIIPEHVMSKDAGSLLEIQETISKGSIKKVVTDVPPQRVPEALEALGSSIQSVSARLRPNSTGSLQNTLPPSAFDPNLSRLWEATTNRSHTTMMGFKGDRTIAQARFAQEFLAVTKGVPHPSRSFWTPATEGDSLSTGTYNVRFGATPDTGFTDIVMAEQLLDTFKRQGVASKIIVGDNEMFVEISSTHVMQQADAGKYGVDGLPLVSNVSSLFIPPSERMTGITASLSPQRIESYAVDAGQGIKQGLTESAKPFLKVAKKLSPTDSGAVMKAVVQGEKEEKVFTISELKIIVPEITPAGIDAYFSYRSTMDGIAMIRSMQKRVGLDEGGMKQVLIGDSQFYGRVIVDTPTVRPAVLDENGVIVPTTETDKVFTGTSVWSPVDNIAVPVTQEVLNELYATGGRLVRLSGPEVVDGNEFNFAIVRSMDDMAIEALPVYPDFGKVGFASERSYADAGALVVRTGVSKTIDGVATTGVQVVGIAKTLGEAKGLSKYFAKKHPSDKFEVQDSREVRNLINQGGSGTAQPTFMMKRGEHLAGPLQNGEPTRADVLDIGESLQRSIHSSSSFPLELAEKQIEGRWMNQYGNFLTPQFSGAFPPTLTKEMWDIGKIEAAGISVPQLRSDSSMLHGLAVNMRANRMGKLEAVARSQMASWARAVGEPESVIASLASRAITRVAQISPQQIARGTTGTLQIALAITFQPIQNVLNSLTLMGIQGSKGVNAIVDSARLIYAMRQLGNGADYSVAVSQLASSLEVPTALADQFVRRYRTSGIAGSAGEVDNVLRHVTDAIHVGIGRSVTQTGVRAATAIPRNIIAGGKAVVSGSIDFTMYGFWSLSFRKTLAEYRKGNKAAQIGDDDFWEVVRQNTRMMSQNQNGSDLLTFEKKGSALAFVLQFQQHIQKQFYQIGKLGAKAAGADVTSTFAETQGEAARAIAFYLALGGAGGTAGFLGIQTMHELLPDDIANPKTEGAKATNAFVMGGLIDLGANQLWNALAGSGTDEQNVIIAGQVLAGAGADIIFRYVKVIEELWDTGKIDMDVIEGLGGAAAGTFSQTLNIFRLLPKSINTEAFDTPEQMMQSFELLAKITKGGRDIFTGLNMLKLEKIIGTQSGKLSGTATTKTAILKMLGFNSTSHVLEQGYNSSIFAQRAREDALVNRTLTYLRNLRSQVIIPDVPESFAKYELLQAEVMKSIGGALNEDQIARVEKKILSETLKGLHGEETLKILTQMNKYNVSVPEMVEQIRRRPDTSADMVDQLEKVLSVINKEEDK